MLESSASVERMRRKPDAALKIINESELGSAQIHFMLREAGKINKRQVEAMNAHLKLLLHAGLALLNMLLEADLIERHAAREFIQLQQRRIEAKEKTEINWPLTVTVSYNVALDRLYETLINLLKYDDGRIADEAMTIKFSEFEALSWCSTPASDRCRPV